MEVAFNKLFQFFWTIFYFFTQVAVVKVAQLFDNTINHCRREYAISFVHFALTF